MTADVIRRAAAALRTRSAEAGQRYDGQVVLSQGEALAVAELLEVIDEHEPTREDPCGCVFSRADEAAAAILRGQS